MMALKQNQFEGLQKLSDRDQQQYTSYINEDFELLAEYLDRLIWIEDKIRHREDHCQEGFLLGLIVKEKKNINNEVYGVHIIQYESGGALSFNNVVNVLRHYRAVMLVKTTSRKKSIVDTVDEDFTCWDEEKEKLDQHLIWVEKNQVIPFSVAEDWDRWSNNDSTYNIGIDRIGAIGVDDCTQLRKLDAPSVLFNLRRRYLGDVVQVDRSHYNLSFKSNNSLVKTSGDAGTEITKNNNSTTNAKNDTCFRLNQHPFPCIYTLAGTVLLAINPYQELPYLTCNETLQKYQGRHLNDNPPHPFAIAEQCLKRLNGSQLSQTIVVSGISGAGKTETAKLIMRYLVTSKTQDSNGQQREDQNINEKKRMHEKETIERSIRGSCYWWKNDTDHSKLIHLQIQEKLLGMNPILEGFGNAATSRNSNSSRFGRLNKLYFKNCHYIGSGVQTYLLERSRVTHHNYGERNFHVFYQLLRGGSPSLLEQFGLKNDVSSYSILCPAQTSMTSKAFSYAKPPKLPKLNISHTVSNGEEKPEGFPNHIREAKHISEMSFHDAHVDPIEEGVRDKDNFNVLQRALLINGFDDNQVYGIFQILSAMLHLGNILQCNKNLKEALNNDENGEQNICLDIVALNQAARLLGITTDALKNLIEFRHVAEGITAKRSSIAQMKICDTLIRWLYCSLFEKIIVKGLDLDERKEENFIAVLDIYGFEDLQLNSFEQLLINTANEKLQNFFVQHLIVAEQEIYREQEIHWRHIDINTNDLLMKCLTGKIHAVYQSPDRLDLPQFQKVIGSYSLTSNLPQMSDAGNRALHIASNQGAAPSRGSQLPHQSTPYRSGTFRGIHAEPCSVLQQLDDTGRLLNMGDQSKRWRSPDETFFAHIEVLETSYREVLKWNGIKKEGPMTFSIKHFAGPVTYTVDGWVDKNNDRIAPEIETTLMNSNHSIIQRLFQSNKPLTKSTSKSSSIKIGKFNPIAKQSALHDNTKVLLMNRWVRFVTNVDDMLSSFSTTTLSFIRCFKPNNLRQPDVFDGGFVAQQMRQSGTLELLRIFHSGYPSRIPHRNLSYCFTWLLSLPGSQLKSTISYRRLSPENWISELSLFKSQKFLSEFALRLFANSSSPDLWQCGKTFLFSRPPISDQLDLLLTEVSSLGRQPSNGLRTDTPTEHDKRLFLQKIGWKIPKLGEFMKLYKWMALRPWRIYVKPTLTMLRLLRKIRLKKFCTSISNVVIRPGISQWRHFTLQLQLCGPIQKSSIESDLTISHTSPWYSVWRHQIFDISDKNSAIRSILFYDGYHLWICDQLPNLQRMLSNFNANYHNGAERLYFECSVCTKNGIQRLSAPTRKRPATVKPLTDASTSRSSDEGKILAINRHPRNSNLFIVVSSSYCLSSFTIIPTNPLEEKKLEPNFKKEKSNPIFASETNFTNILCPKQGYKKTASTLSPYIKVSRIGRHVVDLKQCFATSTTAKVDLMNAQCVKVCFPFPENETIVLVFWALDFPTYRDAQERIAKGLFTIIDLASCTVVGIRKFKLPSFETLLNSLKHTPIASWRSIFLRFESRCMRPAFRFLFQNSVLYTLPSGRGVVWAGAGFLYVFKITNVFTNLSTSTTTIALNIGVVWSSYEHALTTTEKKIFINWISAVAVGSPSVSRDSLSRTSMGRNSIERFLKDSVDPTVSEETVVLGTMRGSFFILRLSPPTAPLSFWSLHFVTHHALPWNELKTDVQQIQRTSVTRTQTAAKSQPVKNSALRSTINLKPQSRTPTGHITTSRLTTTAEPQKHKSFSGIMKIFELPFQSFPFLNTLPRDGTDIDLSTPLPRRSIISSKPLRRSIPPLQLQLPVFLIVTFNGGLFILQGSLSECRAIPILNSDGPELTCVYVGTLTQGSHLKLSSATLSTSTSGVAADITVSDIYSVSLQTFQVERPLNNSYDGIIPLHLNVSHHSTQPVLYSKGTSIGN